MDLSPFQHNALILAKDAVELGVTYRELARAVKLGQLTRLRRGAYVDTSVWHECSARERHLLRIRSVIAMAEHPVVLAGESAAALWAVPMETYPDEVVVIDGWRGGGRSEPGVRRTSRGARTADTVRRGEFECTTLARTMLQITRELPFTAALPLLDWCLSARNAAPLERVDLLAEARRFGCRPLHLRTISFASGDSGSIGESEARAVIIELGFPAPELQRRFVDDEGEMFSDFYWERFDVAGEFDGKEKYTRERYTQGDPGEVVWREKKREDRLRRQVRTVVRILTYDVKRPDLLAKKLRDAGIHPLGRGG